jgi:hypothetical protein
MEAKTFIRGRTPQSKGSEACADPNAKQAW